MDHQFKLPSMFVFGAPRQTAANDRKWFAQNPGRRFRARLTTPAEIRKFRKFGYQPPAHLRPVTAIRQLANGALLIYQHGPVNESWSDPANFDDTQAEALFDFLMGQVRGSA